MRHDRPWHSFRALLASRWFAAGVLVATAGGALHIAALGLAPISTVQAAMAGGLVLLGVMAERLFGWPVPSRRWAGVALTALGLIALAFSLPSLRGAHSAAQAPTMIAFDLALLAAGGLLLLAQYISARSLQTGDAVTVTALTGVAVNVANIAGGIVIFADLTAIRVGAFLTPVRAATEPLRRPEPGPRPLGPVPDVGGRPGGPTTRSAPAHRPQAPANNPSAAHGQAIA
jgi:hypothetical protein